MNEITKQGIAALRAGDRVTARSLLSQAIQQDPDDATAWLWLTGALDHDEARIDALKQVLRIDPGNQAAVRGLSQLLAQQPQPPASTPPAPRQHETQAEQGVASAAHPPQIETHQTYSDLRETYSNDTSPAPSPAVDQAVPASEPHKTQPIRSKSFETHPPETEIQSDLDKTVVSPPIKPEEFEARMAHLNRTEVSPSRLQTAIAEAILPEEAAVEARRRRVRSSAEGLQTIFRTRPSVVPPLLGFWFFLIGTVAIAILLRDSAVMALIVSLVLGIMLMIIVGYAIISILAIHYELTNQYLTMPYRGKRVRVMLERITLAQCHQNFFQRLLGTGDAHLKATVNFELVTLRLRNIPECQRRVDQILSAVEAAGGVRVRSHNSSQS